MMAVVKAAKRTSPPAFLAAMFQLAWIRPASSTSASALVGNSAAAADRGGGREVFQQRQGNLAGDGVRIELRLLGIFQQHRVIELGDVHLPHAPAAEAPLVDFLVVQQRD